MVDLRKFPGGPVVRTLCFHCHCNPIQSLVIELRSHKLNDSVKKFKTKQNKIGNQPTMLDLNCHLLLVGM